MKDIFIVIPTLNPNVDIFLPFLKELKKEFKNILVYDDGCRSEYDAFFEKLEKDKIIVLHHYVNMGKGRALKDAFNYLLNTYPNILGVVTADSDGQHSVKDIKNIAQNILDNPESLILGCRDFDKENVPKRNAFGNKTTRFVLKTFVGLRVSDTQTGLRGLSKEVMVKMITSSGDRFEYETNMLIDTLSKNVPIKEITIETIYLENSNSESHFNPIKDSFAIYKLFFKYILSSLSSFILDYLFFCLFYYLIFKGQTFNYAISFIIARVISSIYNYFVNAKMVFKYSDKSSIIKYFILVIAQMFVGSLVGNLIEIISGYSAVGIKVVIDIIIFIVNFIIQREFVFRSQSEKK